MQRTAFGWNICNTLALTDHGRHLMDSHAEAAAQFSHADYQWRISRSQERSNRWLERRDAAQARLGKIKEDIQHAIIAGRDLWCSVNGPVPQRVEA